MNLNAMIHCAKMSGPLRKRNLMNISFVVPIHNERHTLAPLAEGIAKHTTPHEHLIYFVDDASTDGSGEVLRELAARIETIQPIYLPDRAGKAAALAAGFAQARGEIVITMDGDLQDDPKEIPRFIQKLEEGYDMVCGWKAIRHDPWRKTIPSRIYNRCVASLFGLPLHDINCGFKAMRIHVAKTLSIDGGMHRLLPVLAAQQGYSIAEIPVEHHPRRSGKSKYGLERFVRGALDVLALWIAIRFRNRTNGS